MRPRLFPLAAAFYLALAAAGLVWLGAGREAPIGLGLFARPERLAVDLAVGAAAGGGLVGLWEVGRRRLAAAAAVEATLAGLVAGLTRGEALALAFLSALAEEIFFRGAVQEAAGWLPAAALFGLLHLGRRELRLWGLFALVAGLGLGGLVLWRGSLAAAVVAHFAVNARNLARLARGAPGPPRGGKPGLLD